MCDDKKLSLVKVESFNFETHQFYIFRLVNIMTSVARTSITQSDTTSNVLSEDCGVPVVRISMHESKFSLYENKQPSFF